MSFTCPGLDNSQTVAEAGFGSRRADFIMCQRPGSMQSLSIVDGISNQLALFYILL